MSEVPIDRKGLVESLEQHRSEKGQLIVGASINESRPLFICEGYREEYTLKIKAEGDDLKILQNAMNKCGIFDSRLSFNLENEFKNIATNEKEFDQYFLDLLVDHVLIPDTNIVVDHVITSLNFIMENPFIGKRSINIPRLLILELEARANRKTNDDPEKLRIKRETMFAYEELILLKESGATMLGSLDRQTHEGFTNIAGKGNTDSWIRREVHDAEDNDTIESGKKPLFITRDMINSLSMVSEGVETIYVSKHENYPENPRTLNLEQIAKLIISCSILFEKVEDVFVNGKKASFTGVWNGKSATDWIKDKIMVQAGG